MTRGGTRREGWGSAEATEMVLNNLFYITAKFSDEHPKETEELWATLCGCWPNNLKVIIRYLIIVSGMAPQELLPYVSETFRVVLFANDEGDKKIPFVRRSVWCCIWRGPVRIALSTK